MQLFAENWTYGVHRLLKGTGKRMSKWMCPSFFELGGDEMSSDILYVYVYTKSKNTNLSVCCCPSKGCQACFIHSINICSYKTRGKYWLRCLNYRPWPLVTVYISGDMALWGLGGGIPYKDFVAAHQKISKTPLKGNTRTSFCGVSQNHFHHKRYQ